MDHKKNLILHYIINELGKNEKADQIIYNILEKVSITIGYNRIFLLEKVDEWEEQPSFYEWPHPDLEAAENFWTDKSTILESIGKKYFSQSNEAVFFLNAADFYQKCAEFGIASCALIPVNNEDKLYGLAIFCYEEEHGWDAQEKEFLIFITKLLSISLFHYYDKKNNNVVKKERKRLQKKYYKIFCMFNDIIAEINLRTGNYIKETFQYHKIFDVGEEGSYPIQFERIVNKDIVMEDRQEVRDVMSLESLKKGFAERKKESSVRFRICDNDNIIWMESKIFFLYEEEDPAVLIITRDIMEAVKEEREKKELKNQNRFLESQKIQNERYRILIEQTDTMVVEWNRQTNERYFSDEIQKKLEGCYDNRDIFQIWKEDKVIHPDDAEKVEVLKKKISTCKKTADIVFRLKVKGGSYHWYKMTATIIYDETGTQPRVLASLNDVNKEIIAKQDEEKVRKQLETLLDNKMCFMLAYYLDNEELIYASKGTYDLLGITKEEFEEEYNGNLFSLIYEPDRRVVIDDYFRQIKTGNDFVLCFRTKIEGELHWIQIKGNKITSQDGREIIIAGFSDVTELILDARDRKFAFAMRSYCEEFIDINILTGECQIYKSVDNNLKLMYLKKDYEEYTHSFMRNILPQYRESYFKNFSLKNMMEIFHTGNYQITVAYQVCIKGKKRWYKTTALLLDEKIQSGYIISYTKDVTKETQRQKEEVENLKRIEHTLKEALSAAENANKAKSEFLSRMSHDIRTPLNAIVGMARIAAASMDTKEYGKISDSLEKIRTSSSYLLELVNDVLEMSRIESRNMSLNMNSFSMKQELEKIKNIIQCQAEDKQQHFKMILKGFTKDAFVGDELRINQILINILSNAVKFTNTGGDIVMTVEQRGMQNHVALIRFTIKDNGIGMDEKFMKKIFEPFEQEDISVTKTFTGSGLGLSIAKNLVDMMGGEIKVKSKKNKGSEFVVELPLETTDNTEAASNICEEEHDRETYDFQEKRILLVEDNDLNQEIACAVLKEANLTVEIASNGKEAVDMFSASEDGFYDAVLMDIMMPIKNGLEAAKEIRHLEREDAKTVPIIAMTANAFAEDIAKSLAHGMNDHILKPIEPEIVFRTLGKYI